MLHSKSRDYSKYIIIAGILALFSAGTLQAQVLTAYDDEFGIPFGISLEVDVFGILDNDILDGESAGESGATAELVSDVFHGTLSLNSDGSFIYTPGVTFDGFDSFVYRAVFGSVSSEAIVTLTACNGGPDVFVCWNESAFLAKAAEYGFSNFQEGFEDDAAWSIARSPDTAPSVSSQGILWESNHSGSPDFHEITTGPGPARTGLWGIFDPLHGSATGTPDQCDIDNPPDHCLYHDGFTGTLEPHMRTLQGVGGYITGFYGAKVGILLDDSLYTGGAVSSGHQFFGVIDTRPAGVTRFEFRELDGKIGQALYIFGDDFTILTTIQTAAGDELAQPNAFVLHQNVPNPFNPATTIRFDLPQAAHVSLCVYNVKGELVSTIVDRQMTEGRKEINWMASGNAARSISSGIYFYRLVAGDYVQTRKMVLLR
ncbi:MAG: T9SS type A sorting domain-containing protein [Bacteroidales bacterium]|nr:T9SS type A sorting domain-containing protein [Candidatus Latescibacterota bacterium]